MPLPPATNRKLSHTRVIDCRGYEREDGLWDIEGRLTDTKATTWIKRAGLRDLPAGEPAHDMWIRLTVDLDLLIHDAVAITDAGPYSECGEITPKFSVLKGKRIARGWTKEFAPIFGGINGCTHHWELLARIAAVAYQTTNRVRASQPRNQGEKPWVLNTCHMHSSESLHVLRLWPDLYTGPKPLPGKKKTP